MKTTVLFSSMISAALLMTGPVQAGLLGTGDGGTSGPEQESVIQAGDVLPDRYIVQLDSDVAAMLGVADLQGAVDALLVAVGGGEIIHLYKTALTGAAVAVDESQARILESLPGVLAVEPDTVVTATAIQANATWGLDRVDQPFLPLDETYQYPDQAGQGVHVYIIDTGIRDTHEEFTGRVMPGRNFAVNDTGLLGLGGLPLIGPLVNIGGETDPEDTTDCNGHGTHVASTSAGTTYGVAKQASVAAVRVLDCSGAGSTADVIAGVDWVAENHEVPAVANMSLGGGNSEALDDAVRGAIEQGVTFAVAAGNSDADACNGSPNRVPEAITVGSTNRDDQRSSFSNFGECLDLFAPGSDITGAWYQSDTETNTISGTSMASPHVAGVVALLLGDNPGMTPSQVDARLVDIASDNVLSDVNAGSPNLLLQVPR